MSEITQPMTRQEYQDFIDEPELLKRIPRSRRTIGYWREKGILPYIDLGGHPIYHWPSVRAALLRFQKGVAV